MSLLIDGGSGTNDALLHLSASEVSVGGLLTSSVLDSTIIHSSFNNTIKVERVKIYSTGSIKKYVSTGFLSGSYPRYFRDIVGMSAENWVDGSTIRQNVTDPSESGKYYYPMKNSIVLVHNPSTGRVMTAKLEYFSSIASYESKAIFSHSRQISVGSCDSGQNVSAYVCLNQDNSYFNEFYNSPELKIIVMYLTTSTDSNNTVTVDNFFNSAVDVDISNKDILINNKSLPGTLFLSSGSYAQDMLVRFTRSTNGYSLTSSLLPWGVLGVSGLDINGNTYPTLTDKSISLEKNAIKFQEAGALKFQYNLNNRGIPKRIVYLGGGGSTFLADSEKALVFLGGTSLGGIPYILNGTDNFTHTWLQVYTDFTQAATRTVTVGNNVLSTPGNVTATVVVFRI